MEKKIDLKGPKVNLFLGDSWRDGGAVLKVGKRVVKQGGAVTLHQGAEVTAWVQGRVVAIARIPEKATRVTVDENSTAEWLLALCRVSLPEEVKAEFASLLRQRTQEGLDVYQMMAHPDLFVWLAQRTAQPTGGLKPLGARLGGLRPDKGRLKEGWRVLPATDSLFREEPS